MAEVDKAVVETPQGEASVAQVETPRGREGVLAKWKKANPEAKEDPTDDDLWRFAGEEYDGIKSGYREMSGANARLSERVSQDPKLGAVLSMIAGENAKSLPYAISRIYGKDILDMDAEEYEKGYQDFLSEQKKGREESELAHKNWTELTVPRLLQFAKDNNLTEGQLDEVFNGLKGLANSFLMSDVSEDLIDLVYKGLSYDSDVQKAADTGFVEGKNEIVDAKMKRNTADTPIPDFANGTGAGMSNKSERIFQPRPESVYDNLKDVE